MWVRGSWSRALDGSGEDVRSGDAQVQLGRRGGDLEVPGVKVGGKRRGRDREQAFMEFPARQVARSSEPLREIDLINVPGADVFLGAFNGLDEFRS